MTELVGLSAIMTLPIFIAFLTVAATVSVLAVLSAIIFFAKKREEWLLKAMYFIFVVIVARIPALKVLFIELFSFCCFTLSYFTVSTVDRLFNYIFNIWVLWFLCFLTEENKKEVNRKIAAAAEENDFSSDDGQQNHSFYPTLPEWFPAPRFNPLQ